MTKFNLKLTERELLTLETAMSHMVGQARKAKQHTRNWPKKYEEELETKMQLHTKISGILFRGESLE